MTGHLWSLAVEEQFYLIWPPLFVLAARRRWAEGLAWGLVRAILIAGPFLDDSLLDFRIYTRGLAMMVGAALALTAMRSDAVVHRLVAPPARPIILATVIALIASLIVLRYGGWRDGRPIHLYFCPVLYVAIALLVTTLWYGPADRISRALSWGPLAYLGRISYGLYLYHMAAHYLAWSVLVTGLESWDKGARYGLRLSILLALTLAFASLSYHMLEQPFLRLRSRLR